MKKLKISKFSHIWPDKFHFPRIYGKDILSGMVSKSTTPLWHIAVPWIGRNIVRKLKIWSGKGPYQRHWPQCLAHYFSSSQAISLDASAICREFKYLKTFPPLVLRNLLPKWRKHPAGEFWREVLLLRFAGISSCKFRTPLVTKFRLTTFQGWERGARYSGGLQGCHFHKKRVTYGITNGLHHK